MAIAFARARYISRAVGGSATRSAAYNAREAVTDERTGELFYFKHRDAPEHHEVLLPDGADTTFSDSARLWNAAEAAEKRKDAQVARELVIALPANRELAADDRLELVRSFAEEHFVSKGLAVQLDVHAPHDGDAESESANHHAHLLITTRRLEGARLAAKKARDLDPEVKRVGGRAAVTEGEAWGALWRDHQNRYFADHGLGIRVDATDAAPQHHVGPVRMRATESAAVARAEEIARENGAAARDPEKVLAVLTRNNATFTERELDRHVAKHVHDAAEHLAVKEKVLGHAQALALYDRDTGTASGRWTTREVREQERTALADGDAVAGRRHRAIGEGARAAALEDRSLRADQQAAFDHATGAGGLKIVEGRAGTGKSYTLGAIREAHECVGYAVVGLAPTNSVAQDLRADGFAQAATAHSELFRLKNGRTSWTPRTLVIVDEAAMLDARVTGELLVEARRSGAKLILAGDDRQLASIERGGLFTELKQRHGSAEITEVTRQSTGWQRQAARDMAEGRTEEALRAFAREKAVVWSGSQDEARAQLVSRWKDDTAVDPGGSRFAVRVRLHQS
jgi:Ti-type conjugative transfer relaxase TraA